MRKKLKKARKEKGFFQSEVAKIINVSERQYRRLEAGESDTSGDNWIRIHEYLDKIYPLEDMMKNT